jgi:MinD-like ATPase involved in chromosome partitioning or flagellar assembly
LQLSATNPVRWVSKSCGIWLTLEEMPEPGEPARPPHEDQEGRLVTMNNDTPQVFGEDTRDYPVYPGPMVGRDDEDFPAFRGWGQRVEPLAPDEEYPQPSFEGYEPASYQPYYPPRPGPGPQGYPPGPGYVPGPGYAEDPGYGGNASFERYPEPVPVMEPLPDPEDHVAVPAPVLLRPRDAAEMAPLPTLAPPAGPDGHRGFQEQVLAPPPVPEAEYARETSDSLTTESLLHGKRAGPGSGWRRNVYRATGGLLRFGESAAEMRRRNLINRVRTPVAGGHHRVAVLSLKGGVGKTTTAVGLGATMATLRGDRVIAIDANSDRGTLSDKVRLETVATIRDLLNERDQVSRYADLRAFTSQAASRLEVLASDRDPGVSVAFGADDYCDVAQVLEHFYSICITDCGTGLLHSAMSGVLQLADQIILVSSPSVDGARSASATLDWLEAHNCADLVRNGVVVLSPIRAKSKSTVDLNRLERHFASRCRAVARIPYDSHLEEGAEIELELLGSDTAEAYLALAAVVGDGLAWPRRG